MSNQTVTPSPALDALDTAFARLGAVMQLVSNHDCHEDRLAINGSDLEIAHEELEAIRLALHNATHELRATLEAR